MTNRKPAQLYAVANALSRRWKTLGELAEMTGHPPASISARIRELRRLGVMIERDIPLGARWPARYRIMGGARC